MSLWNFILLLFFFIIGCSANSNPTPSSVITKTPGNSIKWILSSHGQVPTGALQGGKDENGNPLFICRAKHGTEVHPGRVIDKSCSITYGGIEILESSYEVLSGINNPDWQFTSDGKVLPGAVQGGQEIPNRRLFICRIQVKNKGLYPGKLVGRNCNVSDKGKEIFSHDYELLVNLDE